LKTILAGWLGSTQPVSYSCVDVVAALNRQHSPSKAAGKRKGYISRAAGWITSV